MPEPDITLALAERRQKLLREAPSECPACRSQQLQLWDWVHSAVAVWRCRHCRQKFYFELTKD